MATAILFPHSPEITATDYCVFGLATCFIKEEGEVSQVQVLEPIPSAALEAILKGIPTSYQWAGAEYVGTIYDGQSLQKLADLPADVQFCENFEERLLAAVRTYRSKPAAQAHIAIGQRKKDLNYSLERKRVLNSAKVVRPEDNVKQHPHTHQIL